MCDKSCPECVTCPRLKRTIILSTMKGLSPESRSILKQMDPLTLLALKILPSDIIEVNKDFKTNDDIKTEDVDLGWEKSGMGFNEWKKKNHDLELIERDVSSSFQASFLDEDDFFGKFTCIDNITQKGMRSTCLFPMVDKVLVASSIDEAKQIAKDLKLVSGEALPETYNTDFDMQSDESFSRMFFYSLFAPLVAIQKPNDSSVRRDLGPFVVDLPLQGLKVRKNYRQYGARIHFSQDQQVTAIFDYQMDELVKPGDEKWESTKVLAKITAFTLLTAREHLVWSHLVLSNTVTKVSTLELPPSHVLRRLLTVFTYRTTTVNSSAFGTLVNKSAILHRALALEYGSLRELFEMAYTECNIYQPFIDHTLAPEIEALCEEDKFPYVTQGRAYWKIVHKFVTAWIAKSGDAAHDTQAMVFYKKMRECSKGQAYEIPEYKSDEEMINLITQIIFTVTAFHELVGMVVDYIKLPDKAGFRVLEDHSGPMIDIQSWLLGCLIGAQTSIRMPKLNRKFENFFGAKGGPSWERSLWDDFLIDLNTQSKAVQEADAKRDVEFKYFDPDRFECSISV